MRIDPKERYAGISILEVRKLLKGFSHAYGWTLETITFRGNLQPSTARALVKQLLKDRYIEKAPNEYGEWRNTEKGNALANASATAPLRRKSAEARLGEFLSRVRHVNSPDCPFLYTIAKVVLFGSMLTDKEGISDIDISFQMVRKKVSDYVLAGQERVQAARSEGRDFRSYYEELDWPEKEVVLFLRHRSRSLSFVQWNEDWMAQRPHRVIYDLSSANSPGESSDDEHSSAISSSR